MKMARVKNAFHDAIEWNALDADQRADAVASIPEEWLTLTFDRWTNDYRDQFNNVWVTQGLGRKLWAVASREGGNVTAIHSRHRCLDRALAAAKEVLILRHTQR
jgi:hypothetical protein